MKSLIGNVVVKLYGGLGNQMFQYAFGQKLKDKFGVNVSYDVLDFEFYNLRDLELQKFNVSLLLANENFSKKFRLSKRPSVNYFLNCCLFRRRNYFYEPKVSTEAIQLHSENYFWGYWQDTELYDGILKNLQEQFTLSTSLSPLAYNFKDLIENSQSVSIHIRKSDYLLKKNNYFTSCGIEYYTEAINIINSKLENPTYFIFSDDFDWVETNLELKGKEYVFVKTGSINSTIEDFVLMKTCKHNVIANSTYSWWAAYLNDFAKKIVICPNKWHNNSNKSLNRKEWIKINNG